MSSGSDLEGMGMERREGEDWDNMEFDELEAGSMEHEDNGSMQNELKNNHVEEEVLDQI